MCLHKKGTFVHKKHILKRKKLFPFTQTFDSLKSGKVEIRPSASDVNPEAETFLDEGRTSQGGRPTQGAQEFLGSTLWPREPFPQVWSDRPGREKGERRGNHRELTAGTGPDQRGFPHCLRNLCHRKGRVRDGPRHSGEGATQECFSQSFRGAFCRRRLQMGHQLPVLPTGS